MAENGQWLPVSMEDVFKMYKAGRISYNQYVLEKELRKHGRDARFMHFVPFDNENTMTL